MDSQVKPYYSHAGITIYHGDCREIIPTLDAKVDLVLTDPPYGISYSSNWESSWKGTSIANDESTALRDWVLTLHGNAIVFGSWKEPRPYGTRQILIWDKGAASGMGDLAFPWKNSFEEIYILGSGYEGTRDEAVIKGHILVTSESMGRFHPNQKPVPLIRYLMAKHKGETVLDPFMGSGSTLRAAKDIGRQAIGIEIEERYCEIAARRLGQEVLAF